MKPIPGYPGYFATENGDIISDRPRRGYPKGLRKLSPSRRTAGHLAVNLMNDGTKKIETKSVHHLLLTAFAGPKPDGHVGAHLDGNPANNKVENLKWVTQSENMHHKLAHGTSNHGERSGKAKLNWKIVDEIWREYEPVRGSQARVSKMLSKKYGVSIRAITDVITGRTWNIRPDHK